jgi:hypothetical protein
MKKKIEFKEFPVLGISKKIKKPLSFMKESTKNRRFLGGYLTLVSK